MTKQTELAEEHGLDRAALQPPRPTPSDDARRVAALKAAREIIARKGGGLVGSIEVDAWDVVKVAEYIITGQHEALDDSTPEPIDLTNLGRELLDDLRAKVTETDPGAEHDLTIVTTHAHVRAVSKRYGITMIGGAPDGHLSTIRPIGLEHELLYTTEPLS